MRPKTRKDHVNDAAKAHTDLVLFAKIAELAEGADITATRYGTAQKIVKLCKTEQDRCLRDYDRAVAAACKE